METVHVPKKVLFHLGHVQRPDLRATDIPDNGNCTLHRFQKLDQPVPVCLRQFLAIRQRVGLVRFFKALQSRKRKGQYAEVMQVFPSVEILPFGRLYIALPLDHIFRLEFPA